MKISIKIKIITFFTIALLVITGFYFYNFQVTMKGVLEKSVQLQLQSNAVNGKKILESKYLGSWKVKNGRLYKGYIDVSENRSFVEEFGKISNSIVSFSVGAKIVSTNLKKDGKMTLELSPEVQQKVLENGEVYLGPVEIDGESCYAYYEPLKNSQGQIIGTFGIAVLEKDAFKIYHEVRNRTLLVTLALFILGEILLYVMISRMLNRLDKTVNNIKVVAEGKLYEELFNDRGSDELYILALSCKQMVRQFREVIYEISRSFNQLNRASEELNESAMSSSRASEEVARSIEEVAIRSQEQANYIQQILKLLGEILEHMQLALEMGERSSNQSRQALEAVNQGQLIIEKMADQISSIQKAIQDNASVAEKLVQRTSEIEEILNFINSIANQTQLLALNAAIEAARAGDVGRGFSVVAEEIKSLAEEVSESAGQIQKLIKETQNESEKSQQLMDRSKSEAEKGFGLVEQSKEIFNTIQKGITETNKVANQTRESIISVMDLSQNAAKKMDEVAMITKETSSNAEEVAAATEEQSVTAEEVADMAEKLKEIGEKIGDLIKKFDLGEE
ncbi:hypothetical protein BBF96_10505 [Anoxybacter fermentans]|uniref:Methyl-accepting transducer domain-containing protein n=1 Tax=Anoxybacter fermentans TaxID=1323375 RepID=A0A3Q9HR04_9FIRM|nr:methyl-accepting chemotaxis protein [Anoxybacter fermentans]AZR73778.1 hypothetical protein BBF96_10505 [Anoxybacter fermentans]